MDICDKSASMVQCGKENSPEAVDALINSLEFSMSVSFVLVVINIFVPRNTRFFRISIFIAISHYWIALFLFKIGMREQMQIRIFISN
jgi:hypothetical protein